MKTKHAITPTPARAAALNLARLQRGVRWLAFLAALASMLALLGTMTGGLRAAGALAPAALIRAAVR
jgi:biopolymer transport protein ExbB/TolQ